MGKLFFTQIFIFAFIGIQWINGFDIILKDSEDVEKLDFKLERSHVITADPDYTILVSVEYMKCDPLLSTRLVLNASESGFKSQCMNIQNEKYRKFKPSSFQIIGKGEVSISIKEDIEYEDETFEANIVASVFKEKSKCSDCGKDEFCCNENSACSPFNNQMKARCIHKNLKCNADGRPYCGLTCNADQTAETCSPMYFGFVWSSVLFFLAFLSVPTFVVILICCYRKSLRERLGTISIRRSTVPDRGNEYPTNDFPPTYADAEKPPSFATATSMNVHSYRPT